MKREPWHANLLELLADLADVEAQRLCWLTPITAQRQGVLIDSPAELICGVFDDCAIDDMLNAGPVFSPSIDALLAGMSDLADAVDTNQSPENLLADPQWHQLTELAGTAKSAIAEVLE